MARVFGVENCSSVLAMPLRRAVLVGTSSGGACAPVTRSPIGVQALRTTDGDDHFVCSHMDAVFSSELLCKCLTQREHARRRRIVRLIVNERSHGGEFDVVGRLEERLASMQGVHLQALGPQSHYLIADLHDV